MNLFNKLDNQELERGKELKKLLNNASNAYYNMKTQNDLLMSDVEYDKLYEEYETLEKKFPELKDENSPTVRVGAEIVSSLEKVNHLSPLLSINLKAKTEEKLRQWYRGLGGNGVEILVQPKFDGLTIDVVYKIMSVLEELEATLDYGATRGNGYIGEVITHNIKTIKSIPDKIKSKDTLEVRGEGIIYVSDFWEKWSKDYSNPRNLVAGTLRQLDGNECAKKKPDVIFYDLGVNSMNFSTDVEQLEYLKSLGFKTAPYIIVDNEDELVKVCETRMNGLIPIENGFNVLKTDNEVTDIMCDGLVLKVNDLALRNKLGMTEKGPRYAFAWKFKSLYASTTLRKVEVGVGRTGKITPVAIFDPINLGGVTVTNATLNNYEFIDKILLVDNEGNTLQENYGVKLNDTILIERSNDVIPRVIGVVSRNENSIGIDIPNICPTCGESISKIGALHICENINCPDRLKGSLELFVSRDAMNIVDMGIKNIDLFVDKEYIKNLLDIYSLKNHREEIVSIKGFGAKKIDKILKSIEESKNAEFNRVLYSLGIPSIGRRASKTLCKHFKNIDNLIAASKEELLSIEDVGPETTKAIKYFFNNQKNIDTIEGLKSLGLKFEIEEVVGNSNSLQGMTFVITGTIENMGRKDIQNLIELHGGKSVGSVSKKTSVVIIGEDAGSKQTKAENLKNSGEPIKLIYGHDEFVEFLKGYGINI